MYSNALPKTIHFQDHYLWHFGVSLHQGLHWTSKVFFSNFFHIVSNFNSLWLWHLWGVSILHWTLTWTTGSLMCACDLFARIYTLGPQFIVSSKACRCLVCTDFDSSKISWRAQSLALNRHPSMQWPHLIMLNLTAESECSLSVPATFWVPSTPSSFSRPHACPNFNTNGRLAWNCHKHTNPTPFQNTALKQHRLPTFSLCWVSTFLMPCTKALWSLGMSPMNARFLTLNSSRIILVSDVDCGGKCTQPAFWKVTHKMTC